MGQQVKLNDGVSINLPDRVEKLNKEQAISHARQKFNNNKIVLNSIDRRSFRHIYKVDDVLITLFVFDTTFKAKDGHIAELKKGLDGMSRGDKTYTSFLKTINNNSVLILNHIAIDVEYYNFYCYNANNTRVITGILEFNIADKDKATTILNDIINSIKFKD